MADVYESKRQMFHHYVGHYLCGLEGNLEEGKTQEVLERKDRLVKQLKGMGNFDLASKCLTLIENSDFLTIEGIGAFRGSYNNLDPKSKEFSELLKGLKAEKEYSDIGGL